MKLHSIGKYPKRIMMWIAISPRGVSKPVIIQSGTHVNREVYREMTVEPRTVTVYRREIS